MSLARPLAAELIGTALLTAVVFGSTLMGSQLAAGAALGLLVSSLATGAALFVLITILGPVSGAHMNPAVSLAFALRREVPVGTALAFVLAQVLGAILGAMLAHLMFDQPALQGSMIARNTPALWLSELVATAGLVLVILGGIAAKGPVPALVGAYIMAGYWLTASTGFANPAITLARTLTASGAGLRAEDFPAYVLAQLAGALLGLGLGSWLFARDPR
jgi:glycerol uptake facilitator-like aquaporin